MPRKHSSALIRKNVFKTLETSRSEWRKFGVKRLGVFGSVVRGEATAKSDVDILVEFEKGKKSYQNFIGLAYCLEDLIKRKVDLLTPEGLSPYIGPRILEEVQYVSNSD